MVRHAVERRAACRPKRSPTVDIRGIPPTLAVRDRLKDAQADQILVRNGAMSVATMAMRNGLDPEQEQQLIEQNERLSIVMRLQTEPTHHLSAMFLSVKSFRYARS